MSDYYPNLRPAGRNRDEMIASARRMAKANAKRIAGRLIDWLADLARRAPKSVGRPRKSFRDLEVEELITRLERKERARKQQKRARLIAEARQERKQRIRAGEPRKAVTNDVAAKLARALGRAETTAKDLVTRSK